jgi:hypothetical protein
MGEINLEQEVDALERNLETAREQRDELLDLVEELLDGMFLRVEKWAEEARTTTQSIRRRVRDE